MSDFTVSLQKLPSVREGKKAVNSLFVRGPGDYARMEGAGWELTVWRPFPSTLHIREQSRPGLGWRLGRLEFGHIGVVTYFLYLDPCSLLRGKPGVACSQLFPIPLSIE